MIFNIDTTPGWPTIVEIGIRRLFRLDCEISLSARILRFGLTVKTPFTGTIRKFGINRYDH